MAHPLATFIEETGETVAAFARRVGVNDQTLEEILADKARPSPMIARRIIEATGGAISFDQLMTGREAVIADLSGRITIETSVDLTRLSEAIGAGMAEAFPHASISHAVFEIAAEAVAHTYAALARVTTERGAGRLVQALRPVLGEILKDHGAPRPHPQDLDAAALAVTERYHRI